MPYVGSVSLLRLFLFGPIFNFFIFFLNALKRVSDVLGIAETPQRRFQSSFRRFRVRNISETPKL